MNLEQVDAFLAVVEHGTFSRAAEKLYITQSALSHRIAELEKELGVTLFVRKKGIRKTELSAEGAIFLPLSEELRRIWHATANIASTKTRDKLLIAVSHSIYSYVLIDVIKRFNARNLPVDVRILSAGSVDSFRKIEHGEIDFAITGTALESRDAQVEYLAREEMVFVSSSSSSYPGRVHVSELDSSKQVRFEWGHSQRVWRQQWFGVDAPCAITVEEASLFFQLVDEYEDLWAIMPRSVADVASTFRNIKISALDHPAPSRVICLASSLPAREPYHTYLLEDFRSVFGQRHGFILE